MEKIRVVWGIVKADFKERTRNYGFLLILAVSVLAAYAFIPPYGSKFAVLDISGYRGLYNSAWVGASVAMSTTSILFLLGFFYVKSAIEQDRQTRVGQIITTTPTSKIVYLVGKFVSNLAILSILVASAFLVSIIMQLARGESLILDFVNLALPFLIVVFPVIVIVAALAVLFEAVNVLKSGFGNVVYFFIWAFLLKYESLQHLKFGSFSMSFHSLMGAEIFKNSMGDRFLTMFPDNKLEIAEGLMFVNEPLKTFLWEGVNWNFEIALGRSTWFLVTLIIVLIGVVLFKGFEGSPQIRKRSLLSKLFHSSIKSKEIHELTLVEEQIDNAQNLTSVNYSPSLLSLIVLETKLSISRQTWWWYLIQLSLIVQCIWFPFETVKQIIGPFSWCWPLLIWSSMGTRETMFNTKQVVFSCPFPIRRHFIAIWISGLIITLLTGSGLFVRLVMERDAIGIVALLVGAMFIPSLALTLGVWTRTNRTFEVAFMIIMFMGVFNKVAILDFMGIVEGSISSGFTIVYFFLTVTLFLLALYGRKRQIVS